MQLSLQLQLLRRISCLQIAEHVLGQHMYRAPGTDGHSVCTDKQERCALDLACAAVKHATVLLYTPVMLYKR